MWMGPGFASLQSRYTFPVPSSTNRDDGAAALGGEPERSAVKPLHFSRRRAMPLGKTTATARPVAASSAAFHRCPDAPGVTWLHSDVSVQVHFQPIHEMRKFFFLLIHLKGTANAERAMMSARTDD